MRLRIGLAVWSTAAAVSVVSAAQSSQRAASPRFTQQEMLNALDLSRPDLAAVKQAVESGDLGAAQKAFVAHLKSRTAPKWHFDWRAWTKPASRPAGVDTRAADQAARNVVVTVSVKHDYGQEIDWFLNPTKNRYNEYVWQLGRHPYWRTLRDAYWATGDEKYAQAFVRQLNSWIDRCPRPDDSGNYRDSAWRTIECGIRMGGSWPTAFLGFMPSPSFEDASICKMVASMVEHAHHLMKYPTRANWLTMESNGLFHVGVFFPEFKEAASWRDTALKRLRHELDAQVYPDGAQMELSTGYHQVALRNFVQPVFLARLNGIELPGGYIEKLERMYHYNLYAAMPDLRLPDLNDGGHTDVRSLCREGYEFFPNRKDFLWAATDRKEGSPPSQVSYAFPYAGHLIMRTGWGPDDAYLLFDAGPFGLAHQHEDKLHFVLYAQGRELIIDPGNYPYDTSPWRKYHIGSFAHNVVHVDLEPQNRRALKGQTSVVSEPLPHEWRTDPKYDYASAVYDDGYGSRSTKIASHRREILFVKPDYWVVIDTLQPRDDRPRLYEAFFHTVAKPEEAAMDPKTGLFTTKFKGGNIAIAPATGMDIKGRIVAGQEQPNVQGWLKCGAYDVRPAATAVYTREGKGVVTMAYVFRPFNGATPPIRSVEAFVLQTPDNRQSDATGLRIRLADGSEEVLIRTTERDRPVVYNSQEVRDRVAIWTTRLESQTSLRFTVPW